MNGRRTNQTSLVGDAFGSQPLKWHGGALATSNGAIYYFPSSANQLLAIDPLGEFSVVTKETNMEECIWRNLDSSFESMILKQPQTEHILADCAVTKYA